ncbi:34914_t:CDS:2, partial [Racocetra persica]
ETDINEEMAMALKSLSGTQNVSLDFLNEKLRAWKIVLDKGTEVLNDDELKIKKDFLKTDEIIFSKLETSRRHL